MAPTTMKARRKRGINFPTTLNLYFDQLTASPYLLRGVEQMMTRAEQFNDPRAAMLAGIAVHDPARRLLDEHLDRQWSAAPPARYNEVIIGGGLHAAIYAAARVANGFPRPLVLEGRELAGGAMAASREAAFWLNSRNRPGPLGIPGNLASLNVLPGAPVQPSDIGGDDFQSNRDLAFVIRATLACNAQVHTGQPVAAVTARSGEYRYALLNDIGKKIVSANRVVLATGLGTARALSDYDDDTDRILTFAEFMARMDTPFPLRNADRIAVVGAGDSGKTIIEAITGQGPTTHWSVASLDWPTTIDWYGCKQENCTAWEDENRSRYRRIGVLLGQDGSPGRVKPRERAENVTLGYESVRVNERPYDLVINCTGFKKALPVILDSSSTSSRSVHSLGGKDVARRVRSEDIWLIGPGASLGWSDAELAWSPKITQNPENVTALFRWADRTALLAKSLPKPAPVDVVTDFEPAIAAVVAASDAIAAGVFTGDVIGKSLPKGLGADRNGTAIFVGNYVTMGRNGPWKVLGYADQSSAYLALAGPTGGYSFGGEKNVYGAPPDQCVNVATPALAVGQTVRVIGSSRYSGDGPVVGTLTSLDGGPDGRPVVQLLRGVNDAYTPSRGRVCYLSEAPDDKPF